MSVRNRVEKQKLISASRLEQLTGGLAPKTVFTEVNLKQKRGQLKNFSSAIARHIGEEGRVGMLITLTFGNIGRINLIQMTDEKLTAGGKKQHKSLMSFLNKMRRSKRIKEDIRYMATTELQSDGNLHSHIFLSVEEDDYIGLIEFIYDFKKRYAKPYTYQGAEVYPIGRLHIGISARYRKDILRRYTFYSVAAKSDASRTENYISSLESREFKSGDWTPIEFYDEKMLRTRYKDLIVNYLTKTLGGKYVLEKKYVKEGVAKCQLGHDTKTVLSDDYISKLQVRFVRSVGRQLYTHSVLPFSHKLYQRHYRALKEYNPNYTLYYRCITDVQEGKLIVKDQNIFDDTGYQIAPVVHQSQKKESL